MNKEDSKKNNNRFLLNFKEIPSEIYMLLLSLAPSCAFYIAKVIKYRINSLGYSVLLENELNTTLIILLSTFIYYLIFIVIKHHIKKNNKEKILYNAFKVLLYVINYFLVCIIFELEIINIYSLGFFTKYSLINSLGFFAGYSLIIGGAFWIIKKIIKKENTSMKEEFSIFILALLISIAIAETFTNSKILNISSIYLVKHEGREMVVFDKDKDKAILCDYCIDNNKMEYKCQENNVIISLDNITMYKLKLDSNN